MNKPIVCERKCPEGLVLRYTLDKFCNFSYIWRHGYQNEVELSLAKKIIYGPIGNIKEFEKFMDKDRDDFLKEYYVSDVVP